MVWILLSNKHDVSKEQKIICVWMDTNYAQLVEEQMQIHSILVCGRTPQFQNTITSQSTSKK
jgi:hypothetical protein